jgi:hypothetical protein
MRGHCWGEKERVLGFGDSWEKGVDDVPRELDSLVFFGIGMNHANDSLFDLRSKPWFLHPEEEIIPRYQFSMSIVKRNTYQFSSSKELRLPRTIFLVNFPFCNACSNGILRGIYDSKREEEYKARTPNIGNTRAMMANRSRICP